MKHMMRLHAEPFQLIKNGSKTIEMRLYDDKRRLLQVGDILEFQSRTTGEVLETKVLALHLYSSFEELYKHFDKISLGYLKDEEADPNDMSQYYTLEEQEKYGVVGIEIQLV